MLREPHAGRSGLLFVTSGEVTIARWVRPARGLKFGAALLAAPFHSGWRRDVPIVRAFRDDALELDLAGVAAWTFRDLPDSSFQLPAGDNENRHGGEQYNRQAANDNLVHRVIEIELLRSGMDEDEEQVAHLAVPNRPPSCKLSGKLGVLRRREALSERRDQKAVVSGEEGGLINPQAREAPDSIDLIGCTRKFFATAKIKPVEFLLCQADDEVLQDTVAAIVVVFRVQVDSAAAERDFDHEFRRTFHVVVHCRARLSTVFWENSHIQIRLRLPQVPKEHRCVITGFCPRGAMLIRCEQSTQFQMVRTVFSP